MRRQIDERFQDRTDAGKFLAQQLTQYSENPNVIVLALPRGGVPVGYEVAAALHAPLQVFLVRKLGVPGHEEFAMGAIASGGISFLNDEVVKRLGISRAQVQRVVDRETEELQRRAEVYDGEFSGHDVRGKIIILVDDGLATGSTMRAAITALKRQKPERIVVAVPVASPETCHELRAEADEVICARTPEDFQAVGQWYENFSQTSDEEVRELLQRARAENETVGAADPG